MTISISDLCQSAWESRTIRRGGPYEQTLVQLTAVEKQLHNTLEGEMLEQFDSFSKLTSTLGGISDTESFELGFRICFALLADTLFGKSESFSGAGLA